MHAAGSYISLRPCSIQYFAHSMSSRPGRPSSNGCFSHRSRRTAELALFAKGLSGSHISCGRAGKSRSKSRASENFEIACPRCAAIDHRDVIAAERRHQALEPVFVRRDGMRGDDGDEAPLRFLDADVERVAEREVFRAKPYDPCAARRSDIPRAIDRAGVHQQHFEVAAALPRQRFEDLWKPPLFVEGADDDAGFWRVGACHGLVASTTFTAAVRRTPRRRTTGLRCRAFRASTASREDRDRKTPAVAETNAARPST